MSRGSVHEQTCEAPAQGLEERESPRCLVSFPLTSISQTPGTVGGGFPSQGGRPCAGEAKQGLRLWTENWFSYLSLAGRSQPGFWWALVRGFPMEGFLEEVGVACVGTSLLTAIPWAGAAATERVLYPESHSLSRGQVTHPLWVSVCSSVK